GRTRQQGISQPDRRRLAARRVTRQDQGNDHRRAARPDAGHGRCGRHARRSEERGQLCVEPVGQSARLVARTARQGEVPCLYGLPWLDWGGRQAVLFDLGARRFYIFGLVLYPQDFIYLTGVLVISALSLFLFTAIAGRLWCGFTCPQTVYTEMFLWIERKVEGDRPHRMKLDA